MLAHDNFVGFYHIIWLVPILDPSGPWPVPMHGPSLAAWKSPKLKDLRIRCHVLDRTSVEELKNIRGLIGNLKGLELLALDPLWPAATSSYRSAWLDILLEISNNHSSTLRGLVIRERRLTHQNLETHKAMITAAKRCKTLRLLEIDTTRECRIRKNYNLENKKTDKRQKKKRNYSQGYPNWRHLV